MSDSFWNGSRSSASWLMPGVMEEEGTGSFNVLGTSAAENYQNSKKSSSSTSSNSASSTASSISSGNNAKSVGTLLGSTGGSGYYFTDSVDDIIDRAIDQSNINNALYQQRVEDEREFNAAEAQKNREWQEYMSNTAHQREVADLIAAGLNPILSVNSGAATTSGATANSGSGDVDTGITNLLTNYLGSLINSATAINSANIYSNASMYSAEKAAAAQLASAGLSSSAARYSADQSFKAQSVNTIVKGLTSLLNFL